MGYKKTSIGGQALIEGIMMKGPYKTAMAVRKTDGSIDLSEVKESRLRDRYKFFGLPLIRGMVNLVEAMVTGYKAMMRSADISGFTELEEQEAQKKQSHKDAGQETEQDEKAVMPEQSCAADTGDIVPSDTETAGQTDAAQPGTETADKTEAKDPAKKDEKKGSSVVAGAAMAAGSVLGIVLAVVLFMYLPALAFKGIDAITPGDLKFYKGLIEGVIKMAIFIGYIALVSLEKDIKRVFMYHGSEHKTIFCYEHGLPLTVENVRIQKRFHPRCGTSFMFLMLAVGILISSLLVIILPDFIISRNYLWVPIKILLIPVICGLGYELIRLCGRHDNVLTRIIAAPGLWIQRLTTKEPDDSMIEVAIAAMKDVIPDDGSDEIA